MTTPAAIPTGPIQQLSAKITICCSDGQLDVTGRNLQSILRMALDPRLEAGISLSGAITESVPWVDLHPITLHREMDPLNTFISTPDDAINFRLKCAQSMLPCTQDGFMAYMLERNYGIIARSQPPSLNGHHAPTSKPALSTPFTPQPSAHHPAPEPPSTAAPESRPNSSKYRKRKIHYPLSRKGRGYTYNGPVGEDHRLAKLTETQVLEIRELWPSVLDENGGRIKTASDVLGRAFGCTAQNIELIVKGQSWRHLLEPGQELYKSKRSKLTSKQVLEIRRLWPETLTRNQSVKSPAYKDLADHFSVTPANIEQIISRRTWKHL